MPIQGLQFTIPNNQERHQSYQATGSFIIYNPNDGICFIATDRTATTQSWDYKVPSQSGGRFPGPINSYLSVVYQDQSGGASTGQIVVYASADKVEIPHFWSIGRAVQTAGSIMDISQGTLPQNPPLNTVRLWADGNGDLHTLNSSGTDDTVLDTGNYNSLITMVGDVVGPLSNTQIYVRNNANIYAYNNTGVLKAALNFGGGYHIAYGFENGWLFRNYAQTADVMNLSNAGALSVSSTLSVGGNTGVTGNILSTGIVYASVGGGPVGNPGDLNAIRAPTVGYLWFGSNGAHYIGFDGTNYLTVNGNFQVGGNVIATGATYYLGNTSIYVSWSGTYITTSHPLAIQGASNSPAAPLALPQRLGTQICLYDNGSGSSYGFGINGGELCLMSNGVFSFRQNLTTAPITAQITQSGALAVSNTVYFTISQAVAITWNGTYLNHSHSIQFNTIGNQIVWPNGSFISGNAGYVQGSKREQKQNIVAVSDELMLSQVVDPRLGIYTYEWKEDERMGLGFMLDEVEQVLPAYVVRDEDGESTGYTTQELTVILWGAVRELANKIYGVKPT